MASRVRSTNLGCLAIDQGDLATAWPLNQERLAIGRELGDRDCIATSLNSLGSSHSGVANLATRVRSTVRRSRADASWAIGSESPARWKGQRRSRLLVAIHSPLRAHGALRNDCARRLGRRFPPNERSHNDRYASMARLATDDEGGFDRAWRQGREMSLNEAIELAFGATIARR